MFFKLGEVKMESNKDNDYTARQLQSVEITQAARPCPVTFVKLVLLKNHQNRKNQYNQVTDRMRTSNRLPGWTVWREPHRVFD